MKISTFLVDLDGVVIDRPGYFSDRAKVLYSDANHEEILDFFTKGAYKDTTLGKLSLPDELSEVIESWNVGKGVEEVLEEWFAGENIIDHAVIEYIQTLRQKGIACVLATDHSLYRKDDVWENVGLKDYFDDIIASADLGATKEEAVFYEKAMERLNITDASEVLFTDDDPENTAVAKEVGLTVVTYTGLDTIKEIVD